MDIIKNLKRLKILCKIGANIMMLIQIILVILILLLSTYAFLQLLHNNSLDFLKPLVLFAKSVVQFFFKDTIKAAQPEIDGELVVFIVLDIILAFIAAQLKAAFKVYDEQLDKKIVEEKAKVEDQFNKELSNELHRSIISCSNYMLGVLFKTSPLVADSLQIFGEDKIDLEKVEAEVNTKFVAVVQKISGIKLMREGKALLILSSKFDTIDPVLSTVQETISRLKKECKAQKVILKARLAVETYKPLTSNKKVFASIKPLLDLNLGSDALCYGNFKNRYELVKEPKFNVNVKGRYDIENVEETIYSLVKKS